MKDKKTLVVLIPALIIVWGMIIYRLVETFSEDDPTVEIFARTEAPVESEHITYALQLDYPDPFLKAEIRKAVVKDVKKSSTKPQKKPVQRKVRETPAPKLRYNGRVENRTSNEERHLISINGNPHIVALNELVDEVTLQKVFTDSVQFRWNKETIYVKR
ncbi:MAG: hypothetical protein GC178_01790 [Flavobacteriales bacterium]|nr:hypothetical protein [Flavobacteriales bacterium]